MIGTYALDTKVSGNTSNDMPCAAWALPASNPIVMNNHKKAKPNRTHRAKAARLWGTLPWTRNPTAKPMATVTARVQASTPVSATARPASTAARGIGRLRNRSTNPCSRSSATPAAVIIPANSTDVVTNPGTRKSTYGTEPVWMAPPNT